MSSVWVGRDLADGDMQYVAFSEEPMRHISEGFVRRGRSVRVEMRNEIGIQMVGRKLDVGECVEVVCSEVVT